MLQINYNLILLFSTLPLSPCTSQKIILVPKELKGIPDPNYYEDGEDVFYPDFEYSDSYHQPLLMTNREMSLSKPQMIPMQVQMVPNQGSSGATSTSGPGLGNMMEFFYDYYEYGPDYRPGPGWFGPPPPAPHPPAQKPPSKWKPKPDKDKGKDKEVGPTGGWGPEDPDPGPEEKPKDKLAQLKDKWNSLLDKLKIKDKDKEKESVQGQKVKVPSVSVPSVQFTLEQLPGWNAPPPKNPVRAPPTSGSTGSGGGWGWDRLPPQQTQPTKNYLEIWIG